MTNLPQKPILLGQLNLKFKAPTNSPQMKLSPQLFSPCPWTVHLLQGGWSVCRCFWSVGFGRSKPRIMDGAVWCGGRAAA